MVVIEPKVVLTVNCVFLAITLESESLMTFDVIIEVLVPFAGITDGFGVNIIFPTGDPGIIVTTPVESSIAAGWSAIILPEAGALVGRKLMTLPVSLTAGVKVPIERHWTLTSPT